MSRNVAASIRARLKQKADATRQDFNLTLTHYGLERLLYRLSLSRHAGSFLLKGALLFSLWYEVPHRATRDMDLLGFGPDDVDSVVTAFREISAIQVEDGMAFDLSTIKGTEIRKEAGYGGVRVDLRAVLDGARISLQIDVGFGDVVTPAPVSVSYPVLLSDLPAPALRAYPKYTVVAEKFHALCVLGMTNSRMKDYFDLWILLREDELDGAELRRAIEATFARRKTPLPTSLPIGLGSSFAEDAGKQKQWTAFLKKNQLAPLPLQEIVHFLSDRLHRTNSL
ncbi:nucleotidyl transferase AbiEii/AbiGii toxin family protein [Variovorax sp. 770b2]|uniref:nucleotidyl transferase AbiEii/AbiGii toxin family protein n=1 Tax=Variovorax sp. 770b2 TaxID=1566271 RepID=UPI0008E20F07|nr:nucleotidyl transferase AbiEii/AbiGii toxin family protein [Variovorax sp. 770b2]SFP34350.1 Nucleotidyl transferase AbiEii toxin, Type IV TA system [Variovorax sp. 770b2]